MTADDLVHEFYLLFDPDDPDYADSTLYRVGYYEGLDSGSTGDVWNMGYEDAKDHYET